MTDIAIDAKCLGKRYQLGAAAGSRYKTLRDAITTAGARLLGRDGGPPGGGEPFWALKDVNFRIGQGEAVGIIGRNGAGKSTLLKVLSRITEPTEGGVDIHGRVGSLLEVGTGFHPELSGRENIYLNGAILGMRRAEIARKFDEIVAFAEVAKFVDTPVKHYSSGMYTRLAFAVAAHLESEILIVDEVLAVGDAHFQKKCLGKMTEVTEGGRTVLFVSHNMEAVQALCNRVIWLEAGRVRATGVTAEISNAYLAGTAERQSPNEVIGANLGSGVRLAGLSFEPAIPRSGQPLTFDITIQADHRVTLSDFCIIIYSRSQSRVCIFDLRNRNTVEPLTVDLINRIRCVVPRLGLVEGDYVLGLYAAGSAVVNIPELVSFPVAPGTGYGDYLSYPPQYRGVADIPYSCEHSTPTGPAAHTRGFRAC